MPFSTTRPDGRRPTRKLQAGLAPQLTLEAAILRQGGFKDIPAGASLAELTYLRLSGGDPAGEPNERNSTRCPPTRQPTRRSRGCAAWSRNSPRCETPYQSFTRPQWVGRTYSDYDHLARVKEWSAFGGEDDGELT